MGLRPHNAETAIMQTSPPPPLSFLPLHLITYLTIPSLFVDTQLSSLKETGLLHVSPPIDQPLQTKDLMKSSD